MAGLAVPPMPHPKYPQPLGQQANPSQLGQQSYSPPRMAICVSDVERLAKAGVQVKWEDIASQVYPDDTRKDHPKLIDALRERLYAPARIKTDTSFSNTQRLFGVYDVWVATAYRDKVYVFAFWSDRAPMILEDDINLYPSDGLITKIRLIEDAIRSTRKSGEESAGVTQAPTTNAGTRAFP